MKKLIITPKTKLFDLLEAYPKLEEVLTKMAPEFHKLKNPILRRTIARITSISQAAIIGGLNIDQMVNRLRSEVGQERIEALDDTGNTYHTMQPDWFSQQAVVKTIDVREMLNHDEQPVHEVLAAIRNLKDNQILEIIAPFVPAPLIDKSLSLGYKHWLRKQGEEEYRVYFRI